ncbi:hypothetical protein ATANTOWER_029541, partial [Ataeniobius toweri]|nr:hypothetical protein [Ataeniobius toweri]
LGLVGVIHFGRTVEHTQLNRHRSSDVTGIINPPEKKCLVAITRVSHGTTQRRRISGETKASRRTSAPQDHSRKSLKVGNLSDTRRSEDSYTDRRPRQHPAQVKTHRGFISKEMSFLLVDSVD